MSMIRSFIKHVKWFNRKSQHYVFSDWFVYVWDDQVKHMWNMENGGPPKGWKAIFNYMAYYPVAMVKFIWLSRTDIANGKDIF